MRGRLAPTSSTCSTSPRLLPRYRAAITCAGRPTERSGTGLVPLRERRAAVKAKTTGVWRLDPVLALTRRGRKADYLVLRQVLADEIPSRNPRTAVEPTRFAINDRRAPPPPSPSVPWGTSKRGAGFERDLGRLWSSLGLA